VTLLPVSATQHWLQRHATTLAAIAVVLAMSISLAWQSAEWLRQLRNPAASSELTPSAPSAPASHPQLARLFGHSQPGSADATATNLRLTLLGSFVHTDPKRSSAIIRSEGSPAQRYSVDSEITSGVRLHAVSADRVELLRNGRRESLSFPLSQPQDSANTYNSNSAEDPLEQLSEMENDNLAQLRERMDALRQQMEASGTLPADAEPTDQPTEND
jgi:general secretion pathway protein C